MKQAVQQGFTLIELLIAVAIVGILAAIAVPAYNDYVIRAQISEGLSVANGLKAEVEAFYSERNSFVNADLTALSDIASTSFDTQYVSDINVDEGTIILTYGNNVNAAISGNTLALQPYAGPAGQISWRCGEQPAAELTAQGLTGGSVASEAQTNVPIRFLPSSCK